MLTVFRLFWLPTVTSVLNLPESVKNHAAIWRESDFFIYIYIYTHTHVTESDAFLSIKMPTVMERALKYVCSVHC